LDLSPLPRARAPQLDPQQQAVVDHRDGPLLVLAGPGTGKTTTVVESVAARLDEGQPPGEVLVLTFGRRAAGEVRDRIAGRVGGGLLPQVATFHSFAYGLIRSYAPAEEYLDPPRLLSGAEEDQRIRELIAGSVEDQSVRWPEELREALGTYGLAAEVRVLIARMRERGLSPARLRAIADERGRSEWRAVADIAEQEEDVMVLQNVMDYAELMRRAVLRAGDRDVRADLHSRLRAIYVDEFQDTDPLQVELLRRIAGPNCSVVAVGDPDQAIYAFRGADVQGILDFPETFRRPDGQPAPIVALRSVRRYGPMIADAAKRALAPRTLGTLPIEVQRHHRDPAFVSGDEVTDDAETAVRIVSCSSRSSRDAHIAAQIRSAHVHDRVPWQDMAVLVRSSDDLTRVERALKVAGVPASVTADEVPLRAEPAVAALLLIVEIAARPHTGTPERIEDLLLGPIGRMDVSDLRRLGRALRSARREAEEPVLPARELVADVIVGDEPLPAAIDPASSVATSVERVRTVLAVVAEQVAEGASIGEVLWTAWTGGSANHRWPDRLREAALDGSTTANHDLDAVIALFDTAERLSERYRGVYAVTTFLDTLRDQAIPAESIAESASSALGERASIVRIMTVHRAKGLEWSRVWITGLEEGRWPNVQPRGSLLAVEELAATDHRVPDLIREERNLLYVAITRARDQVTLLPVDSGDEGDDRPSRFIADLTAPSTDGCFTAGVPLEVVSHRSDLVTSWSGLVADLRRALVVPETSDATRNQAASLLARIAQLRDRAGHAAVQAADPHNWWGLHELSEGPTTLRPVQEPIALSGSSLDAIGQCSMKWFLDHEVHAEVARSSSTAFGSIIHAIADNVARGEIPDDIEAMDAYVDRVWTEVGFDAPWRSASERAEARRALERFLRYHHEARREFVESERYIVSELSVPTPGGGYEDVKIRGFLDRIEKDAEGRWVAIDFKTSSSFPTQAETDEHGQLGLYQLLLRDGYASSDAAQADVGGAALIQLRKDTGVKDPGPKEQMQTPLPASGGDHGESSTWIEEALGEAAEIVRGEDIRASVGKHCRYCNFVQMCPAKSSQVSVIELDGGTDDFGGDDE
jgi:superfamily I DNA/RNA helicase/RecB family exonuclease